MADLLADVTVVQTAMWRPYYLARTLDAWLKVRGFGRLRRYCLGVGDSPRRRPLMQVVKEFAEMSPVPVEVRVDEGVGPWRAIGDLVYHALEDRGTGFVVYCDEDTLVADDALELLAWQRERLAGDPKVLLVNLHSRCGQGWDGPDVKDDPDADPALVRLEPYLNQWGWGTWRDRWEKVIGPDWDWDGSSATRGVDGGCDWNLATRTMRGFVAGVPAASRTQHIGMREGLFSTPETLAWSQAASFREHRDPVEYRLG